MAIETQTILRGIYRSLLIAEDIEEGRAALRAMMDEKDLDYVEKSVTAEKENKRIANMKRTER